MIRIVVKTLKFRGEDTTIYHKIIGGEPRLHHEISKFVLSDLSPKDDQNRGEDTKISKIFLGRTPLRQNNQSQYNTFNNCIPRTKYVRGILWFSRRSAAASAAAASADTSSFSR